MKTRALGRTGFAVSAVGAGTWGLASRAWRDRDPADSQHALRLAVECGLSFIDTALVYGDGHAEKLVGEVIRDTRSRDHVVVATKAPPLHGLIPAPETRLREAFVPEALSRDVEQSLRNLRAEAIPLAQLHCWRDEWLDDEDWPAIEATMKRLIKEGKVLHWGVSANTHQPHLALRAASVPIIETVQVVYNIFHQAPAQALFAAAEESGTGIIARCVLDEGALTGSITPDSDFPRRDWRHDYFSPERRLELHHRLESLREFLGDWAPTLSELALRFALNPPQVSTAIVGMRTPAHVTGNLAAASGDELPPEILGALAESAWDKNWYSEIGNKIP